MVKPPIVFIAGMLRAREKGVNTESWSWISDMAGQRPFQPAERRRLGRGALA